MATPLIIKKTKYANVEAGVKFGKYLNGRTAIWTADPYTNERYIAASVNIPAERIGKDEVFIKDHSENEGVAEALVEAGILQLLPEKSVKSGFVTIDLYKILRAE